MLKRRVSWRFLSLPCYKNAKGRESGTAEIRPLIRWTPRFVAIRQTTELRHLIRLFLRQSVLIMVLELNPYGPRLIGISSFCFTAQLEAMVRRRLYPTLRLSACLENERLSATRAQFLKHG